MIQSATGRVVSLSIQESWRNLPTKSMRGTAFCWTNLTRQPIPSFMIEWASTFRCCGTRPRETAITQGVAEEIPAQPTPTTRRWKAESGRIRGRWCCSDRSLGPVTSSISIRSCVDRPTCRKRFHLTCIPSSLNIFHRKAAPRCSAAIRPQQFAQCCPSVKLCRAGRGTSVAGARQASLLVVGQEKVENDGKFSNEFLV